MTINFTDTTITEVPFLGNAQTLYSVDFRATGESLTKDIKAMFKYENLSLWLGTEAHRIVNELASKDAFNVVAPRYREQSHRSVYQRTTIIPTAVTHLWVGVPHPAADKLAHDNKIKLNYSYNLFLTNNDKFLQKELLGPLTPAYKRLNSDNDFKSLSNGFLKKRYGAGGYGVIDVDSSNVELPKSHYADWYFEERAHGTPHSVQGYINGGEVTIFGYTQQTIINQTIYTGAIVMPVSTIADNVKATLCEALLRIESLLNYSGFFGIDFMLNGNNISILECNMRQTGGTIPALLSDGPTQFKEDVRPSELSSKSIILCSDSPRDRHDVLVPINNV